MRRFLSFTTLLLMLTVFLSFSPADNKTDSSEKKDSAVKSAKKPAKEKLRSDRVKGKILQIEATQRTLTLQVTSKVPQENAGAAQNIANLRRQLIGNRDINSIRSIQLDMAKNEQNLVTYKDEVKKVEITLDDDLKVRTLLLPVEYDDKGRPRKLSEKEKKALKGSDPRAPGYESDFESLKVNQTVDVYLARPKAGARGKSKDKDAGEGKERPKAIMIVIASEPEK